MSDVEIVSMFADGQPGSGGLLGVVPDASHLTPDQMQALARETGTLETVFVLPPTDPSADYRVRVFTPEAESPFGGHPSLGTAVTLARLGVIAPGPVVQQCGARLLPLTVDARHGTISARDPLRTSAVDPAPLLAGAGLPRSALAVDSAGEAGRAGFGPHFHFLPVRPEALGEASPHPDVLLGAGFKDVFLLHWDADRLRADARMFAPGYGIPEDPACSSAALALGLWLLHNGLLPAQPATHRFQVRQGVGTARRSLLTCTLTTYDGGDPTATVSGEVVPEPDAALSR
ncbi:PhzF family phenazine biosynthesis protein [Streptomyces sp. ICBB 8177]|uniref:PhzF family phenazine biosynthesis protein n=1 Tax=Streptomyces sp. ICBB 8177 TaxID=563922 RepID=UPI000D67E9BF|nr:PhzF family phenazine biosynthesis protein [Streptomyces sp. ICBB 8177]AOC89012.1 putative isomerase [Streptomyces sp. ICBB 8177]PWI41628.1 phenazine biosynthesis protein PhzF [Streptomyces sp. ICBB 8177]